MYLTCLWESHCKTGCGDKMCIRDRYWKAAEYEERYGYTVFKDCSLTELAVWFEKDKEWEDMQYHLKDYFPCEYWA